MLGFFGMISEYSMYQSLIPLQRVISLHKESNYCAICLSDENLYGAYKFVELCKKSDIKPILGFTAIVDIDGNKHTLSFYCKSSKGLQNLYLLSDIQNVNQLTTLSYDKIKKYLSDLIVIEPILGYFSKGQIESIFHSASYMSQIFTNYYIGIDITLENQKDLKLDKESMQFCVICHKAQYEQEQDYPSLLVLNQIGQKKEAAKDSIFYSKDDLEQYYQQLPEVIHTTDTLIDKVSFEMPTLSNNMPVYPNSLGISSKEYLHNIAFLGLKKRLENTNKDYKVYLDRLSYELNIIQKMEFQDYFLIVWDFIKYAKKNDILVGPGRGSGCGSLVAYCLGITSIDPLEYGLLFERFLNPDRISYPDIDTDFPDDKREEVIQYVQQKYGKDHVASIVTFTEFQAKSSLREISKVMKIKQSDFEELNRYIPSSSKSINDFFLDDKIQYLYRNNEEIHNLLEVAKRIEGLPRSTGTHAAGIILSRSSLSKTIPLKNGTNTILQTQFDAKDLEEMGFLKVDFLAIRTLTIIQNILKHIERDLQVRIPFYQVPLNDTKTYELLCKGDTSDIFQLDGAGITKVLVKLHPTEFKDLVALLALYRPGPMDQIEEYIQRKNGKKYSYLDESFSSVLEETHGIIVYQEQVMRISTMYAGFTMAQADTLRKAMGKKNLNLILKMKEDFILGAISNGHKKEDAERVYEYIVKFGGYGFNKSHSVAYSYIVYVMSYLKANYPAYFITSILNQEIGNEAKSLECIQLLETNGYQLIQPNINESTCEYKIEKNNILMPLSAIRLVGNSNAKAIIIEREKNGKYKNYQDFLMRTSFSKSILENMIFSCALDEFHISKKEMFEKREKNTVVFDSFIHDKIQEENEEYDLFFLAKKEKSALGFNLKYTAHNYFQEYRTKNQLLTVSETIQQANTTVKLIGIVTDIKRKTSKKNEDYYEIQISDSKNSIHSLLFQNVIEKYKEEIKKKCYLVVKGNMKGKDKETILFISDYKIVHNPYLKEKK